MDVIKLSQVTHIEYAGSHGGSRTEYEPIYIQVSHIESFYSAGHTVIKMTSGNEIRVKETPEEITQMMPCCVFQAGNTQGPTTSDDEAEIPW